MAEFNVTEEIISEISKQFSVSEKTVKMLHEFFTEITKRIKDQYLAHIIRTMEERLRQLPGNEMFRIECSPVDAKEKSLGIANAHYYKGRYFSIFYHPDTEEKQLRIMIAHELGHLFLIEYLNAAQDFPEYDENSRTEPLSSILGIFTILDKNDFYHNKTNPYKHKSAGQVLNDFYLLNKQTNKRL
jgi:Zn-dependent peptidase ImmA (M78 family)